LKETVYYVKNTESEQQPALCLYDLGKKEETNLGDYNNYIVSADRKKMMLSKGGKYAVIDLPKSKIKIDEYVDLSGMKVMVDLKAEWNQIFRESWRQMRDFFYDPNMHGVDWNAVYEKYAVLLPYVNNRNDLNYLIGEMIGELSVGHAYVSGGDKPAPKRIKTGLFGAELSRDDNGYYRIDRILKGENWTRTKRSPLTEIGVDISEGDYIIAINGKDLAGIDDIYSLMLDKPGKTVELTVNSKPSVDGSRKVMIKPVDDEADLYYYNWVQENIRKVNEATDGQVGYIHIPDMGPDGLNEFVKYFYPQLGKKALIIDDRGNGGGNVSPMIIERLQRELVLLRMARNTSTYTMPREMMVGPKVLLIDNFSASDGDLFPYQFKTLGLGKVIGVRSWGGVVGIRGSLPFIDGGSLQKPEFSTFDLEGKWAIEGHGVDPDIIVDNDPAKEYAGEDQQLNKAIEVILEEIKNFDYKNEQAIPDFPDKSK
ncbi:MAG: PDZ domain-containing protein, partial [Bacteroidetes bacterium]|nr:PDZ domain-containing protein [Bacteroidota bacterium]